MLSKKFLSLYDGLRGLTALMGSVAGVLPSAGGLFSDLLSPKFAAVGVQSGLYDAVSRSASLSSATGGSSAGVGGGAGGESLVTGVVTGSKPTYITINLEKMVENVVFEGGLRENERDFEERVGECLLRVLYMAQLTAE